MAWIYLAESEGSALPWNRGSHRSPTVKTIDTHNPFYCPGCKRESSKSPPSGMTLEQSLGTCCHQSILFSEASPARTSARLGMESAWAASEAGFFTTSRGLSKKQTRDLYFSKTSQQLELVASTVSSKHLPNSGMIVDGRLYQPKKLAPVTFAKDGSYLPTQTAQSYGSNLGGAVKQGKRRMSLESMARRGLIPTPMARDWKASGGANRESPDLSFTMGGYLNPQFVEEIMGYPINHTALSALVTQWFHSQRKQRSKNLAALNE